MPKRREVLARAPRAVAVAAAIYLLYAATPSQPPPSEKFEPLSRVSQSLAPCEVRRTRRPFYATWLTALRPRTCNGTILQPDLQRDYPATGSRRNWTILHPRPPPQAPATKAHARERLPPPLLARLAVGIPR